MSFLIKQKKHFSRYNKQLEKNFPWLIIESEKNFLSGLFCKFAWNTNANWKVLQGMMANLFRKVK